MAPVLRGKLTVWKDDRGFGFISPEEGGEKVFLHISALPTANRRPRVGDTILYRPTAEASGKIRAAQASIQGVALQVPPNRVFRKRRHQGQRSRNQGRLETIFGFGGAAIALLTATQFRPSRSPSLVTAVTKPNCVIKGNISISSGSRLYHLPGMEDYDSTAISPDKGERWFCTEAEAASAGWQRAPK